VVVPDSALRRHLAGAPPVKPIPTDRLPGEQRGTEPLVYAVPLRDDTRDRLVDAGGELAPDLPLTALAALISRYTGETDLVVGLLAGGLTVPRVRFTVAASVADLRAAVTGAIAAAAAVGAVDGADLLDVADVPCHGVVAIRDAGPGGGTELAYADVVLVLQRVRGRPRVALVGNAAVYERDTVSRLAAHLGRLFDALAAAPAEQAVAALPLLDTAERTRILSDWNDTAQDVGRSGVPELIGRQAATAPDAPAVVHGDVTTTFGQLDTGANRLANHLVALGVPPGGNVGVLLDRCAASLLTQLAIWRAGAAVVLLDPEYPTERLAFMLADSAAVAVVTTRRLAGLLPPDAPRGVLVDEPVPRAADTDPAIPLDDESVSHIAYTSGSTGTPKAVLLRHGPLRNTVHVLIRECEITADARGTWLCSPGFGLVEVDPFPVLAAGAAVHIPDRDVATSPERLRDWLVAARITHTLQLTAMAERLWTLPWPADCALRSMRVAGERVRTWPPPELPFAVLNVYGSAEATVVTTCDLTTTAATLTDDERAARPPPVGRPVANVRAYVLDARLEPVPPGVLGELYVSGASLSLGYLNRAAETMARFLANPVPGDPHPVLYRSGDVARYWPDGVIEVVGRADAETKIRGYRVHLGEVESVLAAQPGVRQCAVLAREDTPGYRTLVGYVEPDPLAPPRVRELRAALARRLPPYLLPASYVVEPLPTTANGKIDRAALGPPPRDRPDLAVPYVPPATALERRLGGLLSEVLGIDDIGRLDPFLELGGDSMQAMRLLAAVRQTLGVALTTADLFHASTLVGMAQLVEQTRRGGGQQPLVHDAVNRYEPFPLTTGQRRLWRANGGRLGPPEVYEWHRRWLDVPRFAAAWAEVVARHDALRTLPCDDGDQVVLREGAPAEVLEPAGPTADRVTAARAGSAAPAVLRLYPEPGGGALVQLAVSPLFVDHDSVHRLLLPELATAYERPGGVAAPAVTFRDYARSSLARWAEATADPAPVTGGQDPATVAGWWHDELPTSAVAGLRQRCAAAATTLPDAVVAALHDVLRDAEPGWHLVHRTGMRLTGQPGIGAVVGCFTGARTVKLSDGNPTFAERARAVPALTAAATRCAVRVSVAVDPPGAGRVPADRLTALVATSALAPVDVRVVLDEDALRVHWTVSAPVDPAAARELAAAYRDRLARLAATDEPWWDGVDAFNKSLGADG
jgi:amino acid adenylation domain-containing protein